MDEVSTVMISMAVMTRIDTQLCFMPKQWLERDSAEKEVCTLSAPLSFLTKGERTKSQTDVMNEYESTEMF